MQARKEIEDDLAYQNPNNLVSCVPIKKRLFNSMQASISPLKETYLMPQSGSELSNKFLLREDSAAPYYNDNLAFDMKIKPKVNTVSSSMHYDTKSYCTDLSTPNENSINDNHEEIEIKKITSDFIRSSGGEDLNMSRRPSLGIVQEEEKMLSVPNKSRVLLGDGIYEMKLATGNQEYHGLNSPKQEKAEAHSLDVPLINDLQFLHQTSENNLDSANGSSVLCVNRFNWDLNVPMDAWNANEVVEHGIDHNFNRGCIHEEKLCRLIDQTATGSIGSDLISDASITKQNKHNVQSRHLKILTDGKDHEGDLELQLRPPSRPELRINWDKESLPHLSLSLPVNLSDEFCSAVKPEPCECSSWKDTEIFKCSVHVNSQPCSGNFQSETCKEIDPFQSPSSPARVVNPKAHNELQVKQPDLELDNNQLTSSVMEPILGEPIAVSMNSEASHVADMLPDEVPIIKSDKSTCPTMNPMPVSNSVIACKDVVVHSDVCAQLAEASICNSLDIAEPMTSDSEGNNVTENEICEIANPSTLHSQTVHVDLKEPTTADGRSEGSAEMDCSDDELYTSKMEVTGDVHFEHDKKSLSYAKNGKGTKPHAKIQKEQLIGNEQQVDDPEGVPTSEDGIAGVAASHFISKDFRSRNSEHVATDSTGSENDPIVSVIQLDRSDRQVVFEESRNTIRAKKFDANINHSAKKNSCNTASSSSSTRVLVPTTSKTPNKPTQGATENYIGKKCSEELKSKTIKSPSAIVKTGKARILIGQKNTGDASVMGKELELSERYSDASGIANKYVDKVYHNQNKKVNVGCKFNENKNVSSSFIIRTNGQRTHVSSRAVGDGLVKDCHSQDRHPKDRRHSKFVSKNNQDPQFGKYNSNYKNLRRGKNRDFDRGDDTQYAPRINISSGYQVRRNREDVESPIDFAPNGYAENAGRLSRRPTDVRRCHSSYLSRRHLQSPEEGSELLGARSSGRPLRDISPGRFVGREFYNDLSDYELMRSVPCEMRNNLLYPHPHMQYDSLDLLPRRRSSSPTQRRASPTHLHGPPQAVRLRSPHSRLCFPKDEGIRDPSPPYPQFYSHIREMQPVEDIELPCPPVMNRTTRRLDLGQYETEYPDPRHFTDELVDARNYDERLHVQSLRPHLMPREVAEDILHYPSDDYAYGPSDHCPDSEMFHSRGGSRDFESHLINRPRNASDRIMNTREQGEELRYHSRQGWRHHQLDNDMAKRRRR